MRHNSLHGCLQLKQDGDVDNDGSKLDDEDPDVVKSKTVGLIVRTGPAPSSGFNKIVVAISKNILAKRGRGHV